MMLGFGTIVSFIGKGGTCQSWSCQSSVRDQNSLCISFLGVSLHSPSCIPLGACHNLMKKVMLVISPHVWHLLAQVFCQCSLKSMTVNVRSFNGRESFSVIRSRDQSIWSSTMSNKAMQVRGRSLQSHDLKIFIVMLIGYDYSSKLCFEEKSNSVSFVIIFKKVSS